jgi:Effector Associated Constant Component 1
MASDTLKLQISVNPSEPDAEYRHDLARELMQGLADLDGVTSIEEAQQESLAEGAKGLSLDAGTIIAGLSVAANFVTVVDCVIQWLSRDKGGRSVTISRDGNAIRIDGVNEKSREDLIA